MNDESRTIILTPAMIEAGTMGPTGFPDPTLQDDVRAILTEGLKAAGFTVIEDPALYRLD